MHYDMKQHVSIKTMNISDNAETEENQMHDDCKAVSPPLGTVQCSAPLHR